MRISDWSSDVCSSDLARGGAASVQPRPAGEGLGQGRGHRRSGNQGACRRGGEAAHGGEDRQVRPGDHARPGKADPAARSEEHTYELQSLMRIAYAVFCLKKKHKQDISKTISNYHIP